jgi:uncharacterized protein YciI
MKTFYFVVFVASFGAFASLNPLNGTEPKRPNQFIYVLHLVPRLYDDKAWTEQDKSAVDRHFNRLKEGVKSGQVILAGRTQETGDKTFGIAIFESVDETAAREFMNADPAVVAGVMTAELHPFGVALERKNP